MFHPKILETIKNEKEHTGFIYPFYGKYSIAEMVPTILTIFGIPTTRASFPYQFFKQESENCTKVISFIVDGLGYNHFTEFYNKLSFFNTLHKHGQVFPITSVFPSTTPAALTTLHTGLTPQEHGLPEWTVYFEEFDEIVIPLQFRKQKSVEHEELKKIGGEPEILFEGKTIFSLLQERRITSYYFLPEDYFATSYTSLVTRGSKIITYKDGVELMNKLTKTFEEEKSQAYFFVYWNRIDGVEHLYGPESVEHTHALGEFSDLVDKYFLKKISYGVAKNTLLLLTADHGQSHIRGEDILYLGKYTYLNLNYQRSLGKREILPTGSPHDVFLFIYPPKLEETLKQLKTDLQGKAEVITTQEGLQRGLFGVNKPSERFLKRIGNVLILPYKGVHIWYEHFPPETFHQLGMHGGLSEEEMIVPLALARLDKLMF